MYFFPKSGWKKNKILIFFRMLYFFCFSKLGALLFRFFLSRPETSISGENPCFPISGGHVHPPTTKTWIFWRKSHKKTRWREGEIPQETYRGWVMYSDWYSRVNMRHDTVGFYVQDVLKTLWIERYVFFAKILWIQKKYQTLLPWRKSILQICLDFSRIP